MAEGKGIWVAEERVIEAEGTEAWEMVGWAMEAEVVGGMVGALEVSVV